MYQDLLRRGLQLAFGPFLNHFGQMSAHHHWFAISFRCFLIYILSSNELKNIYLQPPRSAHPNVKFTCTSQEPMAIESLPFDKYELEPSPLTQFILARKQPTTCWQVQISLVHLLCYIFMSIFLSLYTCIYFFFVVYMILGFHS